MHGIIDPGEEAETNGNALGRKPVFTFHDYLSLIGDTKADARETLIRALEQGDLLIVGTSFRDPDIRQWLGKILKEQKERRIFIRLILLLLEKDSKMSMLMNFRECYLL